MTKTRRTTRKPMPAPVAVPAPALTEHVLAAIRQLSDPYLAPDLPAVFAVVRLQVPALTLGAFHDELRALSAAGRIELQPFTGRWPRSRTASTRCSSMGKSCTSP